VARDAHERVGAERARVVDQRRRVLRPARQHATAGLHQRFVEQQAGRRHVIAEPVQHRVGRPEASVAKHRGEALDHPRHQRLHHVARREERGGGRAAVCEHAAPRRRGRLERPQGRLAEQRHTAQCHVVERFSSGEAGAGKPGGDLRNEGSVGANQVTHRLSGAPCRAPVRTHGRRRPSPRLRTGRRVRGRVRSAATGSGSSRRRSCRSGCRAGSERPGSRP
jgi:hypothetical protein